MTHHTFCQGLFFSQYCRKPHMMLLPVNWAASICTGEGRPRQIKKININQSDILSDICMYFSSEHSNGASQHVYFCTYQNILFTSRMPFFLPSAILSPVRMEKQSLQTLFVLLPSYSSGTLLSEHFQHTTCEKQEEKLISQLIYRTFLPTLSLLLKREYLWASFSHLWQLPYFEPVGTIIIIILWYII